MLSRRVVRIKVMQILYATSRNGQATSDQGSRAYLELVDRSFELYLYNLLYLQRIAEYARQDEARRKTKLRPSDEDKAFTAKLANNPLLPSLAENQTLHRLYEKYRFGSRIDADQVRFLYAEFSKTEEYQTYVYSEATDSEPHLKIYLALYKFLINNEVYTELLEEQFPLWTDDKSLIVGAMKKTLKALPVEAQFYEDYRPNTETVQQFGEHLLRYVLDADEELLKIIEPVLKNWDVDRVAIIDMILLKMALGELIQFPTIPTKVTLNEYVEISKLYSTDKSKDFINGILDRLLKKLLDEGLIQKEGRGLLDE